MNERVDYNKFLKYDYVEQRLLLLANPISGGLFLTQNQRLYFGANSKLKGKRLVGMQVSAQAPPAFNFNGVLIITTAELPTFVITIRDKEKNDEIKQYPLMDLHTSENFGKQRIFNVDNVDLENSFITSLSNATFVALHGLFIQFYTTKN